MTSDLNSRLEDAVRAELRSEARLTPAGAATKAGVLRAVQGLSMESDVRHLRRWVVPMLAAAAVVLVAVGLTVGARSLTSSRPHHPNQNQPINQQRLTPPPPNGVTCSAARGETLVNGLQTTYTVSATGQRRYAFEYYCAGSDGHRTGSAVQVFRMVNGSLEFLVQAMRPETGTVVMSLSGGGEDGFRDREAYGLINSQLPFYGAVGDGATLIEGDDGDANGISITGGGGPSVAAVCRSTDLTVRVASAQLPIPHQVLQLTNHSKVGCALWGNPHYTLTDTAGQQPVSYQLRGPAGGVTTAPSAPVIVLQPGATAGASIGTKLRIGSCVTPTTARVTLPDGVDLGLQNLAQCDLVSYPLVLGADGDDSADYPTQPLPTGPASCVDSSQLQLGSHPVSTHSGDGVGLLLTIKLLGGPPCTLSGYPDVRAVDGSNNVLVTAAHIPNGVLGGLATGTTTPPTVTLKPGQTASAVVEWAAAAYTPTSICVPNSRISLTVGAGGATFQPVSRLCDLVVHPFVAGDTGRQ
jgi:hypothetical protein